MTVAPARVPAGAPTFTIPENHVIVLFGAFGDLARRKLLPGLFHLTAAGMMPEEFRIVCTSRSARTVEELRAQAKDAVNEFGREPPSGEAWDSFVRSLSFVSFGHGLGAVRETVTTSLEEFGDDARVLHYLSVPPEASAGLVEELGKHRLNERARIILEKPFGTDLPSARRLNGIVLSVFEEEQVFRIDHYLGREAVQNLLAVRFANGMFEPVWNADHVDHVQIDVPEPLSIGTRGEFYEPTGAFRDMVVTHLFQVLGFVAMEPPTSITARMLEPERVKVFNSMPPLDPANLVRGQYDGYREEKGVSPDSDTETFVALKAFVDNWRWSGVPFYLRTGKRLAEGRHVLTIAFNEPPRRMFSLDCRYVAEDFGHDHLTFDFGDPGTIATSFLAKVPGPALHLGEAHMNFTYEAAFGGPEQALEPYERLIHDVLVGDRTLFPTSEAIERVWEISQPVLEDPPPLHVYEPGSWGPEAMDQLIAPRRWHIPDRHA
jgi:glucose-6-phosphate 1-dehydrogenase